MRIEKMKLSARDTKILDDVLAYAKKNQETDDKAKMFVSYTDKQDLTKSELAYVKNYIAIYRLNDQIESKHQREKTKEMNAAGKRRKALNAAKFGLGGWIISKIGKNEELSPKAKDFFKMVGVMANFENIPDNHELKMSIFNNQIHLNISKKELKNELDNTRTVLIIFGTDNSESTCHPTENIRLCMFQSKRETLEEDFKNTWEDSNAFTCLPDEDNRWVLFVVMTYLESKGYLTFNSTNKSWVWEDKYIYKGEDKFADAYTLK